jgi:hypothetical protein
MNKTDFAPENKKIIGWDTKIGDLLELSNGDIVTPKISDEKLPAITCNGCFCTEKNYTYCPQLACYPKQRIDKMRVVWQLVKPVIIKYSGFLILRVGQSEILFNGINYSLELKTANETIRRTSERLEVVINTFRFYTNVHINDNTIKQFREMQDSIDFK